MQAAIYVRVSTDEQVRHGFSLKEQQKACRSHAKNLKTNTIKEFSDKGISGTTLDRPGLIQLREAVKSGEIDILIVRDPDRLSRKLAHQLLLSEEFEKAGVKLEFLDFTWQDTPEGRLFYSIRGAIAEFEREKIRDRMVRGKTQKAYQGGLPMGFYAYGYTHNPERGNIEINENEAEIVKKIFKLFISQDIGINGIARWLNKEAIPTKKRKPGWHRQVVRQILHNPVYKGEWHYKDMIIPVPPIVDKETWDKAHDKLIEARRLWAGSSQNEYLLSGIIKCSDCGNTMNGFCPSWWGQKIKRYTCRKNYQGAKNSGCRPQKAIPADAIEKTVWNYVCSWLQNPDAITGEITQMSSGSNTLQKDLEQVRKYLVDVEKGREKLVDALSSSLVELDDKIKNKLGELKRRKEKLELQEKELLGILQENHGVSTSTDYLREKVRELLSRLNSLDFSEKKALIRALVYQVIISSKGQHAVKEPNQVHVTVIAKLSEDDALPDDYQ